jgi:hypothetical protein
MDTTAKLNEFQRAPSKRMVQAKFVTLIQIEVPQNGHSRSLPAGIEGTIVSPRFRSGEAKELPVDTKGSFISSEAAAEPVPDPTLVIESLGE